MNPRLARFFAKGAMPPQWCTSQTRAPDAAARHVLQPSCHKKCQKHLCLLRLLRPCPYPVMTLPTLWQVC